MRVSKNCVHSDDKSLGVLFIDLHVYMCSELSYLYIMQSSTPFVHVQSLGKRLLL